MDDQNVGFDPLEAVTVREAAALLHVSRPTVEKYIKNGSLPSIVIGRCRRIRRTDLDAWIARQTERGWRRTDDAGRAAGRLPLGTGGGVRPTRPADPEADVYGAGEKGEDIPF